MSKSKRRPGPRVDPEQPERRRKAAQSTPTAHHLSRVPAPQLLERIERARLARDGAEAELAALVDYAVGLGIGWPAIASRLGVTRQAARQQYHRRHREGGSQDQVA
jgi:hypothetical protein